jgi:metallo-beta-lactamase class B
MIAALVLAALAPAVPEWNRPVEPFQIADGLYYVGASEVTSYLFDSSRGLVILDGGFGETAAQILANVQKLGFKLEDVKVLLSTHGHYDHAGGLAELKRRTGAELYASAREAELLARGGKDDPQFGDKYPYHPVIADRIVRDGETVRIGDLQLVARITPGHTRGCTTWSGRFGGHVALFLCSSSVPEEYKLDPRTVAEYERGFAVLRAAPCELFLGAHGSYFDLKTKRSRLLAGDLEAFVDPQGCRGYVDSAERVFRERLREAQATAAAATAAK